MRGLLSIGILSVFLMTMLMPISYAYEIYPGPGGGYVFYPVITENDAGYAYNISGITFVTTLVNLTGTFSYNSSEGGAVQIVAYYIALGKLIYSEQYGYTAYYIQPVIAFMTDGNEWFLIGAIQAWGDNGGNPYEEYNTSVVIIDGGGSTVHLNYVYNLTIKAITNSQGEITSAYVYVEQCQPYKVLVFSDNINLKYPIPDKQVFFEVEDPPGYPFPVIPSNNYVFTHALASNSTATYIGPPLYNGVCFIMYPPYAYAFVAPTLNCPTVTQAGSQGVHYYW